MIVHNVTQGSDEWMALRCTIPTASEFGKIITPAKGDLSSQATAYRHLLLACWLKGGPVDEFLSYWMERGTEMEPEARDAYGLQTGNDVEQVGFITRDDGMVGCSPDGLVGEPGCVEFKCPAPHTHVGYLLKGTLPTQYKPQVQGQLLIAERDWCDFMSYHPDMPPVRIRVNRDEAYIGKLETAMDKFVTQLLEGREQLRQKGMGPREES